MIKRQALCNLIPHAGSMCLLDNVVEWDEESITCTSESHLRSENPLLKDGCLSAVMLIEYGAQAMAVHGGLKAKENNEGIHGGYLAALRNINLVDTDISKIKEIIKIEAKQLMAQGGSMIYEFNVSLDGSGSVLASGRASVIEIQNEE